MKLEQHTIVSTAFSAALYVVFRSWPMAAAAFVAGVFVDVDHVLDYVAEHGAKPDLKLFFRTCYDRKLKRAILVFHGWEWLVLCAVGAWASGWNPWLTGLALGFGQHMLFDQLSNGPSALGYSLLWRWSVKFDHQVAFPLHKWKRRRPGPEPPGPAGQKTPP